MMASVSGTALGLYFVMNQDLSHGEDHGDHGDHHETTPTIANEMAAKAAELKEAPLGKKALEEDQEEDVKGREPEKEEEKKEEPKVNKLEETEEANKDPKTKQKPSESDKVCPTTIRICRDKKADKRSPTPAARPRARMRLPASRRVSPTRTPRASATSARSPRCPRRARALPTPPRSRAPSTPSVPLPKTRRSAARPSRTRTSKIFLRLFSFELDFRDMSCIYELCVSQTVQYLASEKICNCPSMPTPRSDIVHTLPSFRL